VGLVSPGRRPYGLTGSISDAADVGDDACASENAE
jgi:hypothetical protein